MAGWGEGKGGYHDLIRKRGREEGEEVCNNGEEMRKGDRERERKRERGGRGEEEAAAVKYGQSLGS